MVWCLQMKEFYQEHYSSNIMCLTVCGTQSLDELEAMVSEKFAAVPNSNLQPPPIPGGHRATMPGCDAAYRISLKFTAQSRLLCCLL